MENREEKKKQLLQKLTDQVSEEPFLRNCKYDPVKHLIWVEYKNGTEVNDELYLPVKYRIHWFNVWCEEHGILGSILQGAILVQENGKAMWLSTTKILRDGNLWALAEAAVDASEEYASQKAGTLTNGRALAQLDFTIVAGENIPEEDGEFFPVDSGVKMVRDETNPMLFKKVVLDMPQEQPSGNEEKKPEQTAPEKRQDAEAQAPAPKQEQKQDKSKLLEKAYAVVKPSGKFAGKTIREIAEQDMSHLKWIAENCKSENLKEFVQAAKIVIADISEKV